MTAHIIAINSLLQDVKVLKHRLDILEQKLDKVILESSANYLTEEEMDDLYKEVAKMDCKGG